VGGASWLRALPLGRRGDSSVASILLNLGVLALDAASRAVALTHVGAIQVDGLVSLHENIVIAAGVVTLVRMGLLIRMGYVAQTHRHLRLDCLTDSHFKLII
jgi:hypothetical protein